MSVLDDETRAVVRDSADLATELLGHLTRQTEDPLLALTTLMLSSAVMARSIGLPRQDFLEGMAAAFNSLEEATHHATH